jgi:hypothetical protein
MMAGAEVGMTMVAVQPSEMAEVAQASPALPPDEQ